MFLSATQKRIHQKVSGTGKKIRTGIKTAKPNRLKLVTDSGKFVGTPGIGHPSDNAAYWENENNYFHGLSAAELISEPPGSDTGTAPTPLPWYQNILNVYGAYKTTRAQIDLQKQANDMVQQQIRQGATLSQAQANAQRLMQASRPGVDIGLSTNTMLMLGGGAALLLLVFMMKKS